jgi:hypothetical protein
MADPTKMAYISVDDPVDLAPTVMSLYEAGFHFNISPEMKPWFELQNVPVSEKPISNMLENLFEEPVPSSEAWVFILHSKSGQMHDMVPQRTALISYLASLDNPNILLATHPGQYQLLNPEMIADKSKRHLLSRQLLQDIAPDGVLMLKQTHSPGDIERPLYSSNPAWIEAIEMFTTASRPDLTQIQLKNVPILFRPS